MRTAALVKAEVGSLPDPGAIQAKDYIAMALAGLKFSIAYSLVTAIILAMALPFTAGIAIWDERVPTVLLNFFYMTSIIFVVEFPVVMAVSNQIYKSRLSRYGTEAFVRVHTLPMSSAQAFELCLAACGHVEGARLVYADEQTGLMVARIKQNPLIRPDRDLRIAFQETPASGEEEAGNSPQTTVTIQTELYHTEMGRNFLTWMFGEQWLKFPKPVGFALNLKVLDTVSDYLSSIPNWDHKHISVSEDEHWQGLLGSNQNI